MSHIASNKDQYLFELERETPPARLLLQRIPEAAFEWRPHSTARTLGDLAWHMASIPQVVSGVVQKAEQERSKVVWPSTEPSVSALINFFDQSVKTAKANLLLMSNDELDSALRMYDGERDLFRMPRGQFVRWGMLTHFVHHRAQLGVYLRILDVPIPSLVGPSRDDNPFAR